MLPLYTQPLLGCDRFSRADDDDDDDAMALLLFGSSSFAAGALPEQQNARLHKVECILPDRRLQTRDQPNAGFDPGVAACGGGHSGQPLECLDLPWAANK